MRLEDRDDRRACRGRGREVVVDEVDVRVDHREALVRRASEQVGGAGRLVVEQLAEEHVRPRCLALPDLTSYQAIYLNSK